MDRYGFKKYDDEGRGILCALIGVGLSILIAYLLFGTSSILFLPLTLTIGGLGGMYFNNNWLRKRDDERFKKRDEYEKENNL